MTLNEFLKEQGLTEEIIKKVNTEFVDVLLNEKLSEKDVKIKELEDSITETSTTLSEYKTKERASIVNDIASKLTNKDALSNVIKLADIQEEDDDKSIQKKVQEIVKSNSWAQIAPADDTEKKVSNISQETEKTERKYV